MVNPVAQALQPLQPFIWGRGGAKLTPEQIAREREIAEALGVVDMSPVDHWLQGAARMANAAVGRLRESRADRAEQENASLNADIVQSLLGSIGGSTVLTPSGTSPVPATSPTASSEPLDYASERVAGAHGDPIAWRNAIASIESAGSGDYQAVGPRHPRLGRALGRYQVMEANVGPWTEKHLGRRLTPEEFLASPEAQDAVFDGEFGSYVQQFGDPALAAQAWFAGPGGVGTNRQDSLGTSVPEYARRFQEVLNQNPQGTQRALESLPVGGSMTMPPAQAPIQVAQAGGGINPAIIEALSSRYVNDQTRQIASLLLQQQIQAQQPQALINAGGGNLYDPNSGQWIQAPGVGQLDPTTAQQNYQFLLSQGLSREEAMDRAFRSGVTVNMPGQPNIGTIPPGWAATQDPETGAWSMAPIPGGPAALEAEQVVAAGETKDEQAQTWNSIVNQEIGRALDIIENSGLPTTGMIGDWLSGLGGTGARDLRGLLDTIKANAGFDRLQAMRDASPTGGALGQVSERELAFLQSTIGNLEQSQSREQLEFNLRRLQRIYQNMLEGRRAYDGLLEDGGSSTRKPVTEMTDEELEAIINGNR